ncbi:hypothetical protein ISCGN_013242 [Ixodes scapularis]
MRTESERRGGAGDEATYSPTAARAPEFELEVTVDPVDLWRCGGSVVGCSRSGNRLDENLATALELTEGKTKPDIFYQTAERMDDVKESEKQDVPRSLFHRSVSQDPNRALQCAFCKSGL